MSWPKDMPSIGADSLGDLKPDEVLYEFELPCIFTAHTPRGEMLLLYLVEEPEGAEQQYRFLAATTTPSTVADLKEGALSVRDALTQGWMWIVDTDLSLSPRAVYAIDENRLPEDALPAAATMLWPSLEPELRVRLVGEQLRRGAIPALVFAQAGEIVAHALKALFELAAKPLLPEGGGRPPEWLRSLYNLPTQRVAYGSLELAFRRAELPSDEQLKFEGFDARTTKTLKEVVDEGWELLARGLRWAACAGAEELEAQSEEERLAILEALKELAPSASGPVTLVEVSGARVAADDTVFRLDREVSKKVRLRLSGLKREQRVALRVFTGRVRELDLDKSSIILRDLADSELPEVAFVVEDEQRFEIAREALYRGLSVTVAAKSRDEKKWTAVEIEFAKDASHGSSEP